MAGMFAASFNPAGLSVATVGAGALAGSVAGTGVHTLSYHTQQDAVVSTGAPPNLSPRRTGVPMRHSTSGGWL